MFSDPASLFSHVGRYPIGYGLGGQVKEIVLLQQLFLLGIADEGQLHQGRRHGGVPQNCQVFGFYPPVGAFELGYQLALQVLGQRFSLVLLHEEQVVFYRGVIVSLRALGRGIQGAVNMYGYKYRRINPVGNLADFVSARNQFQVYIAVPGIFHLNPLLLEQFPGL